LQFANWSYVEFEDSVKILCKLFYEDFHEEDIVSIKLLEILLLTTTRVRRRFKVVRFGTGEKL